ncbi:MAG: ABC transporter substrate-binding protein [Calditerrivibrio sp.]|nr:ABC transporter substrate-binding protein [Calditerrivibrio sp.]
MLKYSLKLFIAVFIILLTAGCLYENTPLKIGFHHWAPYEIITFAKENRFVGNVEIVRTASASETISKLKNGSIDAGGLTLDEAIRVLNEGVDVVVVLVFDISVGADMVVLKEKYSDIKGKRVAVEHNGLGALMLNKFFKKRGLSTKDIEVVDLPVSRHLAEWEKGNIDASISFSPFADAMIKKGGKVIFDSREIPDTVVDVLVVKRGALKDKKTELKKLLKGYFKALEKSVYNKWDFYYSIASYMDVDVESIKKSFDGVNIPSLTHNRDMLKVTGQVLKTAKELESLMTNWEIVKGGRVSTNFVTDEFLGD